MGHLDRLDNHHPRHRALTQIRHAHQHGYLGQHILLHRIRPRLPAQRAGRRSTSGCWPQRRSARSRHLHLYAYPGHGQIGGSIFQNRLPGYLENAGVPVASAVDVVQNANGYVTILQTMPKASSYRQAILGAYAQALRVVFEVLTGISALGGLASLAMRHHDMDRKLDSEHVFCRETDGLN